MERADLFVYNGAGMEHWTEDVLNALDNQDLVVAEAAKDLELLQSEESGHGHGGHSHNHSHSLGQGDSEHSVDPHVWLDPEKAKQEMKAILDGFVQADPEHAEYYLSLIHIFFECSVTKCCAISMLLYFEEKSRYNSKIFEKFIDK